MQTLSHRRCSVEKTADLGSCAAAASCSAFIRDELAIFAGQTPDALKTPATPSWLILMPFARTASAIALSGRPAARSRAISPIASCSAGF